MRSLSPAHCWEYTRYQLACPSPRRASAGGIDMVGEKIPRQRWVHPDSIRCNDWADKVRQPSNVLVLVSLQCREVQAVVRTCTRDRLSMVCQSPQHRRLAGRKWPGQRVTPQVDGPPAWRRKNAHLRGFRNRIRWGHRAQKMNGTSLTVDQGLSHLPVHSGLLRAEVTQPLGL